MRVLPFSFTFLPVLPPAPRTPPPSDALPDLVDRKPGPLTREGVPRMKQGDRRWGSETLERRTIAKSGCALTSTAMALAKLSGKAIDPKLLDAHLDKVQGYNGDDDMYWDKAAAYAGADCSYVYSLADVDAELAAGRPVVSGVTYERTGNENDHWILLVAKGHDRYGTYYRAVDPASSHVIYMRLQPDGTLRSHRKDAHGSTMAKVYRSTDSWRAFRLLDA